MPPKDGKFPNYNPPKGIFGDFYQRKPIDPKQNNPMNKETKTAGLFGDKATRGGLFEAKSTGGALFGTRSNTVESGKPLGGTSNSIFGSNPSTQNNKSTVRTKNL